MCNTQPFSTNNILYFLKGLISFFRQLDSPEALGIVKAERRAPHREIRTEMRMRRFIAAFIKIACHRTWCNGKGPVIKRFHQLAGHEQQHAPGISLRRRQRKRRNGGRLLRQPCQALTPFSSQAELR